MHGLSAAVISRDVGRAMALGEQLHCGLLRINGQTVNDDVVNPFGGVGESGNGTSIGGPANWQKFTHRQWVMINGAPRAYPFWPGKSAGARASRAAPQVKARVPRR